jgi:hypothetical protein
LNQLYNVDSRQPELWAEKLQLAQALRTLMLSVQKTVSYVTNREIKRLSDQEAQALRDQGINVEELELPKESFERIYDMSAFKNALIGPVALKLATSSNEAAGIAGTGVLGTIGLLNVIPWGPAPKGTALRSAEDWANWFVSQLGM